MTMIKIFFKDKPLIISSKKADLKNLIIIPKSILESGNFLKLLSKKNIVSLGYKSKKPEKVIKKLEKIFPIIIAAGGKVYNHKNEVLFIFRNKKWDLPKGKAEKNESIDVTALREVYEETGVKDLSISQPLEKTFHIFKRNSSYFLKVTYWFEMKSDYKGRLKPQLKEGISKVQWIDNNEISKISSDCYANIRVLLN